MREKKPTPRPIAPVQRIRSAVQGHSPGLELAFRKLEADERVREEEQLDAIRRAGSSPLAKLEPLISGRRARD